MCGLEKISTGETGFAENIHYNETHISQLYYLTNELTEKFAGLEGEGADGEHHSRKEHLEHWYMLSAKLIYSVPSKLGWCWDAGADHCDILALSNCTFIFIIIYICQFCSPKPDFLFSLPCHTAVISFTKYKADRQTIL